MVFIPLIVFFFIDYHLKFEFDSNLELIADQQQHSSQVQFRHSFADELFLHSSGVQSQSAYFTWNIIDLPRMFMKIYTTIAVIYYAFLINDMATNSTFTMYFHIF